MEEPEWEDWEVLKTFLPPGLARAAPTGALKGLRKEKSVDNLLRTLLIHLGRGTRCGRPRRGADGGPGGPLGRGAAQAAEEVGGVAARDVRGAVRDAGLLSPARSGVPGVRGQAPPLRGSAASRPIPSGDGLVPWRGTVTFAGDHKGSPYGRWK